MNYMIIPGLIDPIKIASDILLVEKESIISDDRSAELVIARSFVCNYYRDKGLTLKAIGKIINKHHSTVVHLLNMVQERPRFDKFYRERLNYFNNLIYNESIIK